MIFTEIELFLDFKRTFFLPQSTQLLSIDFNLSFNNRGLYLLAPKIEHLLTLTIIYRLHTCTHVWYIYKECVDQVNQH